MPASSSSATRIARAGFVNCYLVREDDGLTLIDTMLKGSGKRIVAAAQGLGAPIKRIALTHAHGDHVGAVDELARLLPGVELLISTRDARFLRKDMSLDPDEPQDKLRGGWPGTETEPTRTFEPGERVGSLEVVAAPGHTPGHVAFFDPRDRTLICGDAYTTLGGVRTTSKPSFPFPLAALSTWSRAVELDTAKALRALDPAFLAPGHGKVVAAPAAAMDRAIAKAS
ncbi:Hydroxyacylglutathione hydrolase [Baekduia alba]|uniref:MBL fold metallo-hydrolase n=1 Tax=Baekduia alba TaxID=2997333 RepID=UPI00233FBDBC|nr:MBL fold metallo-hydrolase [Baekduia alba]WCB94021.1 Hydroxyacylglutathione hydrolase [Baekduia alba]